MNRYLLLSIAAFFFSHLSYCSSRKSGVPTFQRIQDDTQRKKKDLNKKNWFDSRGYSQPGTTTHDTNTYQTTTEKPKTKGTGTTPFQVDPYTGRQTSTNTNNDMPHD